MGKPRLFWERMEKELAKREMSLKIATLHDPTFRFPFFSFFFLFFPLFFFFSSSFRRFSDFPRASYGFYVRCNVRCEASDGLTPGQAPTPVETKRGYSITTYSLNYYGPDSFVIESHSVYNK